MLSLDQLIHVVDVERYRGESNGRASYDAPAPLACYLETRQVLLEPDAAEALGVETGLEGRLFANDLDLPAGSKVTVRGQGGYLGAVTRYDDGSGLSHSEVEVTPRSPAAAARTATVSLLRDGEPTWSKTDRRTTVGPGTAYETGLAAAVGVSAATRSFVQLVAEESVTDTPYVVKLDRDVAPDQGDYVRVDDCPGDASLVGRVLRIQHVARGGTRLERLLVCSLLAA